MVSNFIAGTKLKKNNNRKTSPEIGNFVHHIDNGDQTHFFNFLKSVISGSVLQIGGSKFKTGPKLGHFTVYV